MSLTLDEPLIKNVCHSNIHTNSKHAPETYQTWKDFYAKQPIPNQNSCSLEDNIHVYIVSSSENNGFYTYREPTGQMRCLKKKIS